MRQAIIFLSVVGAVLIYNSSLAGPPIPFDSWSPGPTGITASCPAGLSCGTLMNSDSFLQRQITNPTTGSSFFQTILSDSSRGFTDESFVTGGVGANRVGGNGLSNKQTLFDTSTGTFRSNTEINVGWAMTSNAPAIDFKQSIAQPGPATGAEFDLVTHFQSAQNASGDQIGQRLAISQNVGLGWPKLSTLENEGASIQTGIAGQFRPEERQVFILRDSSGTLLTNTTAAGSEPNVRMWIYHWQSTGKDPRQNMPLRGQWFTCKAFMSSTKGQCDFQSKFDSIPVPTLLFDPLPFNAPMGTHCRQCDRSLFPNGKGPNDPQYTQPGPATGGDLAPNPTARPRLPVSANPPPGNGSAIPFGGWTVKNGVIAFGCPVGFSCEKVADGDGFIQIKLVDKSNGNTYFQAIVVEKGSTGSATTLVFSNESVIFQAPNISQQNGVASRSVLNDPNQVVSTETINTGWANKKGSPALNFKQAVSFTDFEYQANRDANDVMTGFHTQVVQTADQMINNGGAKTEHLEKQYFITAEVAGDMLTTSGSVTLPGNRTVTWQPGDDVTATLVTQGVLPGFEEAPAQSLTPGSLTDPLFWNQGWGGPKARLIEVDNLSDTKPPEALVSPRQPVEVFWPTAILGTPPTASNQVTVPGGSVPTNPARPGD